MFYEKSKIKLDRKKIIKKNKLQRFLLIISLSLLSIYLYQANFNSANADIIVNRNDNRTHNIIINNPIELDFLTKQKILAIRKQYAMMTPQFIPQNYIPSEAVFGQIQNGKPWWGLNGMMFKGAGLHSIDGRSEQTRSINNPLMLFIVDPNFWYANLNLNGIESYPKPVSLTFNQNSKLIKVVYSITNYNREMNQYLIMHTNKTFKAKRYTLVGLNARDLGYNFAYAYLNQNILFDNSYDNLSTNVQQLQDFLHTGGSCGYSGGCNNRSPDEPFLHFKCIKLPAELKVKLWKNQPQSKNSSADIYFDIVLQ